MSPPFSTQPGSGYRCATAMRWRLLLGVGVMSVILSRAGAVGAPIVVGAREQKKTYDCKGGVAVVNGGDNVLTFRNCARVTINGGDNTIDVGTAESIVVSGAGNNVTCTPGSDGKRPAITKQGSVGQQLRVRGQVSGGPGCDLQGNHHRQGAAT
jgi:hypothetical protein